MQLKTHGKAVLVIGDTFSCKDSLKQIGGSWNKKLVGWIFPFSKKDAVVEALRKHPSHPSITDQSSETSAVRGGVQFAGDVRDALYH